VFCEALTLALALEATYKVSALTLALEPFVIRIVALALEATYEANNKAYKAYDV
jgi:hypothetical protein